MRNYKIMDGSLTVEAALILPIVLLLFAFVMQAGISLYSECGDTALSVEKEGGPETIKIFYQWNRTGKGGEDED